MESETKVAFITGAARGLGRAVAQKLGAHGHALFLIDVLENELQATRDDLEKDGYACAIRIVNVADRSACIDAVSSCIAHYERLDVLCNVAAIMNYTPAIAVGEEEWLRIIGVNLNGPFWLCQAALPEIVRRQGNIVNVASVAAQLGAPYMAAYAASKGGLVQMTKSLAVEYVDQPVRINVVAPGGMVTELGAEAQVTDGMNYSRLKRLSGTRSRMPADHVAEVVAFVASEKGASLHGAVIFADGGSTIE